MKKVLLLSFLGMASIAHGQITLTQSTLGSWTTATVPDTVGLVSNISSLPSLAPSAMGSWDLSAATYQPTVSLYYIQPFSDPAFTGANYNDRLKYIFSGGFTYSTVAARQKAGGGIKWIGDKIETRIASSLAGLTGNTLDSLIFPAQNMIFSTPYTLLNFPAAFGSTWANSYSFDLNFNITATIASYNNAPGIRRVVTTVTDTVKGWGMARVKNLQGAVSQYMNVLVVKHIERQADSFYVNGAPAPVSLLAPFGLSQNDTLQKGQYLFYREGDVNPLITVDFKTGSDFNLDSINRVQVHVARLPFPTVVSGISQGHELAVYPNPSSNGVFNLSLTGATKDASYQVVSLSGALVAEGTLSEGMNKVCLPSNSASGMYVMMLSERGKVFESVMLSKQ